MQFSALVDADFLDTEAYLNRHRTTARAGFPPMAEYLSLLDSHLDRLVQQSHAAGRADDPVTRARAQVLADCRSAATEPGGVFSLQVPTGGGKTLASLAFVIRHAVHHGLDRVIVAIPFTSIVEQTADVLGAIFGRDNIVEHHSQADASHDRETARSRLACENWDAPLIVTDVLQMAQAEPGASDRRVLALAREDGRILVTLDADFGDLVFRHGEASPQAILYLRLHPMDAMSAAELVLLALDGLALGQFVVCMPEGLRRRPLPQQR